MTYEIGERVYYYQPNVGIVRKQLPSGCYEVLFADRAIILPQSSLHKERVLDADVHGMNWATLQDEVMKLRTGFRYIVSQEGDDLCWRDFYFKAAELLPEGDPLKEVAAKLMTLESKPLMMHNCARFVDSLSCGGEYKQDSKDEAIVRLTARITELEAELEKSKGK